MWEEAEEQTDAHRACRCPSALRELVQTTDPVRVPDEGYRLTRDDRLAARFMLITLPEPSVVGDAPPEQT
jgi:hypothetical protein